MKLGDRVDELLSKGRSVTTRDELDPGGYSYSGLCKGIRRLKDKNKVIEPVRGFLVLVPPAYQVGGPPPSYFIDQLMKYEKREYYVGLLSAAASYGAAHQAPQTFQVIISGPRRNIDLERGRIVYIKNSAEFRPEMFEKKKVKTGYYIRSNPAVTLADLVYYLRYSGGIYNVCNIAIRLHEQLEPEQMLEYALRAHGKATLQRIGYICFGLGLKELARPFKNFIASENPPPVPLNPSRGRAGFERDKRFQIIENDSLDPDIAQAG